MPNFIDMTGQKFNKLTAVRRTTISKHNFVVWLFKCDCGKEIEKIGNAVRNGTTKSCGCLKYNSQAIKNAAKAKVNNLSGRKFGMLTAIKPIHKHGKKMKWLLKCDCGKFTERAPYNLHRNPSSIKSCGCVKADNNRKQGLKRCLDLTGKKFGMLAAIKDVGKNPSGGRLWFCECDCGNTKVTGTTTLTKGSVRSCGCLISPKGEKSPMWKGGFSRCDKGYVYKKITDITDDRYGKKVPVHRLVIEKKLGRRLLPNENVHHINGKRDDNRPENLELWVTSQPSGQRPQDLVAYSLEILKQYAPEMLSRKGGDYTTAAL